MTRGMVASIGIILEGRRVACLMRRLKRLTPGQARYRRYLAENGNMTFIQFLKRGGDRRSKALPAQ